MASHDDPGVVDTLGTGGTFRDPLWRVEVRLSPLEQALLRCWWVRRLGFVAHAGAAVISSTQTYSRLEHSLGLLALVAHFRPDDRLARAAALLHDVGHLPFSHTFEGVAGLDHHRLGAERITELDPVLRDHGLTASAVIEVVDGRRPSALQGRTGGLRLLDGTVDTDTKTADYLLDRIVAEARSQSSTANVVATGVVRHLARQILPEPSDIEVTAVAAMTLAVAPHHPTPCERANPVATRAVVSDPDDPWTPRPASSRRTTTSSVPTRRPRAR